MKKSITVLVPVYNEQDTLPELHSRLKKLAGSLSRYSFEFMYVNDGSTDDSAKIVKEFADSDKRVSYIGLSRNFGKEAAMCAGIDKVDSDALIIIDADLQDPPELIPDMVKLWEDGHDDIYARRTKRLGESWIKRLSSSMFYRVLQHSTNIAIQRDTGDFRLLDRKCVDAIKQLRENERYSKGLFSWIGFNKHEITYVREPRKAGKTKWNYLRLFNLAIDGITSFTTSPLRFSTIVGMLVSLFAFAYIIYLSVRTLIFGADVAGYPSIMAAILFIGGVQLLSLGVIGEYVARIFKETKQRPLYLVDEYHEAKK